MAVVNAIQAAVARGDVAQLRSGLDDWSTEDLNATVQEDLDGSDEQLMSTLYLVRHPARFVREVHVGPSNFGDGHRKVTLTGPYRYLDGSYTPPCGERPLELCVQFVRGSDGRVRAHLDNAFHDILYMLQ